MPLRYLSDLAGTLNSFLRISGLRLKNVGNTSIDIRNNADTQFANTRMQQLALLRQTGTNSVTLAIASEPGASITYNLPVADGTNNQVLATNGSGQLQWTSVATASGQVLSDDTVLTFGSPSTVAMFTPPANCTIRRVTVDINTAFNGSPTMSVGVAGDTTRYMAATENDLTQAVTFETAPMYQEDGSPDAIIITYAAGGATQGSALVTVDYSNPA